MKKIIFLLAVFLTACIPANQKPEKIQHAAHMVNNDSMVNHTAMRLMTDNCIITHIEHNSEYYTVYAYSGSLEKELIILDDMPENVISKYPVNSHIIRLYDYPENVVDIIKRK